MPLNNFARLDPYKLYRSAQPEQEDFGILRDLGITTIFKLNPGEGLSWQKECEYIAHDGRISLQDVVCPEVDWMHPTVAQVAGMVGLIYGAIARGSGVLLHCTKGRDRTGLMAGAWRAIIDKWSEESILAERAQFLEVVLDPSGLWVPVVNAFDSHIITVLKQLAGASK